MARRQSLETRRKWTTLLEAYRKCDETVAEFCRRHQVSAPSFYQWKRRLEKESKSSFVPVVVKRQDSVERVARFQLGGDSCVEVPAACGDLIVTAILALAKGGQP